ncbi:MAG: aldo/keto reductase [Clostridia bacterium]
MGNTGIEVSRLGLGSLTMGRLQKNSSSETIKKVTKACYEKGINFCDGAELYDSYEVLREMVKLNRECVIASKSYAYDLPTAKKAFEEALREIGRDYIDIFLMHEQESEWTIRGHHEALEFYLKMKQAGYIRAVGLSTHKIDCVRATAKFPQIEIVHPLINYKGYGLFDGTRLDMENAIKDAHNRGVGIYSMKIFGGGHLLKDRIEAVDYILNQDYIDASMIGMQSVEEVEYNVRLFERKDVSKIDAPILNKKVVIEPWCEKCMNCAKVCPQNAIHLVDNTVTIDESRCVLCGYCGSACENMCIKMF